MKCAEELRRAAIYELDPWCVGPFAFEAACEYIDYPYGESLQDMRQEEVRMFFLFVAGSIESECEPS